MSPPFVEETIDLDQCPFCGGKAQLWRNADEAQVSCSQCGARSAYGSDTQRMLDLWNCRHVPSVRELVDRDGIGEFLIDAARVADAKGFHELAAVLRMRVSMLGAQS